MNYRHMIGQAPVRPPPLEFSRDAAASQQKSAPFFAKFPPEVRMQIYDYCETNYMRSVGTSICGLWHKEGPPTPELLLTCRLAYLEAKPHLNKRVMMKAMLAGPQVAWEVITAHQARFQNAQELIVESSLLDFETVIKTVFKHGEPCPAKSILIDWKPPKALISQTLLLDPEAWDLVFGGGAGIMQCNLFINTMPNLKVMRLSGNYSDELAPEVRSNLARTDTEIEIIECPKPAEGGLEDVIQSWIDLVDQLAKDPSLPLDGHGFSVDEERAMRDLGSTKAHRDHYGQKPRNLLSGAPRKSKSS